MKNRVLCNTFLGNIEKNFVSSSHKNKFNKIVKDFIDRNNETLYCATPLHRLFFSDERDRNPIFHLVDINKNDVSKVMKNLEHTDNSWKILNDPFNITMLLIIKYFNDKKDKVSLNNAILYLTLSLYSSLHYKYYPYPPNEDVMNYTINNVNNKYLFKKYGVVIKALFHTAMVNHETYEKIIKDGSDENLLTYLENLRTRLNNQMRTFANEYHKNYKEGNAIFNQKDSADEDDFIETDNISMLISKLTDKCSLRFFTTKPDENLIRFACNASKCDFPTLRNSILGIKEKQPNDLIDLFRCVLIVYLNDKSNNYESIASKKFIAYSIAIYSKSNVKDENILKIKDLLDKFLIETCERYMNTNRDATKSNYRKGLYIFFVLFIQQCQIRN